MSNENVAHIKVSLDDESKALLAAHTKALLASAGGKAPPAGKTPPAGKGKTPPADDFSDDTSGDDTGDDTGGEGDGEGGDDFALGEGEEETTYTNADVQKCLRELATLTDKNAAVKILKAKGGTSELSKLKEDKFAAVIDAVNAAIKAAKKAAK